MVNLKRHCPICGTDNGEKLFDIDFMNQKNNPLPERYDIVSCSRCGFCFAEMDSSQEQFNAYYDEFNVYSEAEALRADHGLLDYRFTYIAGLIEDTIRDKSVSILDIGCGGGELLRALKDSGFKNSVGLDPSERSIENLRELGIRGICGNIFNGFEIDERYDVVISTAVIEHIFDLNTYVKKLKLLLRDNGYLIINAPAVEGFVESMLPIANNFNQEHINYFGIKSMDNLMNIHGFERVNNNPFIESSGEKQIVSVYCMKDIEGDIEKDTGTSGLIRRYLDAIKLKREQQDASIIRLLDKNLPIVIWGAGSYTKQMIRKHPRLTDRILFFVDNNTNKQGILFCNKRIEKPEYLKQYIDKNAVILICSMKNAADIKAQIEEMHINNEIFIAPI